MKMKYLVVGLAAMFLAGIAMEAWGQPPTATTDIQMQRLKKVPPQLELDTSYVPPPKDVCAGHPSKIMKLKFGEQVEYEGYTLSYDRHHPTLPQVHWIGSNQVIEFDNYGDMGLFGYNLQTGGYDGPFPIKVMLLSLKYGAGNNQPQGNELVVLVSRDVRQVGRLVFCPIQ